MIIDVYLNFYSPPKNLLFLSDCPSVKTRYTGESRSLSEAGVPIFSCFRSKSRQSENVCILIEGHIFKLI